jgi:hypothetical protein
MWTHACQPLGAKDNSSAYCAKRTVSGPSPVVLKATHSAHLCVEAKQDTLDPVLHQFAGCDHGIAPPGNPTGAFRPSTQNAEASRLGILR